LEIFFYVGVPEVNVSRFEIVERFQYCIHPRPPINKWPATFYCNRPLKRQMKLKERGNLLDDDLPGGDAFVKTDLDYIEAGDQLTDIQGVVIFINSLLLKDK